MAKNSSSGKKKAPLKKRIKRNVFTAFSLFLIAYVGAHFLSRTDGFRQAVADKISNGTRQQVSIEQCGMTPFMGLRLQNLAFQGVVMPDVRITFNWFWWITRRPAVDRLRIDELEINMRRTPNNGHWEPLVLNGVARRLGSSVGLDSPISEDDSLPKFPEWAVSDKTLFQLNRAKMVWKDENGREVAYITDADLKLKSGGFIKRKVIQTIVRCGHIKMASGRGLRDFRFEAFRIEGSEWVTVMDLADSNGEYPEFSSNTLWDDLHEYLTQLTNP